MSLSLFPDTEHHLGIGCHGIYLSCPGEWFFESTPPTQLHLANSPPLLRTKTYHYKNTTYISQLPACRQHGEGWRGAFTLLKQGTISLMIFDTKFKFNVWILFRSYPNSNKLLITKFLQRHKSCVATTCGNVGSKSDPNNPITVINFPPYLNCDNFF